MRWILPLVALTACNPCPPGFSRQDGHCLPESPQSGNSEPLTSEGFRELYQRQGCQQLEDCWDERLCGDLDDCSFEIECDPVDWSWATGCTFVQEAAEACLGERWTCDESLFFAEEPEICEEAYNCNT